MKLDYKLRIQLLFLFIFTFSKPFLFAQHCPFDAEGIIVVTIHAKGDSTIIQNLKITLIDSAGNTVMTPKWDFSKFLTDTLKLWQNPDETTFKTTIDCDHPADPTKIRFPFAKDNYVLMCPIYFKIEKYKLRVEDTDDEKNGGSFSSAFYQFKQEDIYSLCGTYKSQVYPEEQFENKVNYAPITIELSRQ